MQLPALGWNTWDSQAQQPSHQDYSPVPSLSGAGWPLGNLLSCDPSNVFFDTDDSRMHKNDPSLGTCTDQPDPLPILSIASESGPPSNFSFSSPSASPELPAALAALSGSAVGTVVDLFFLHFHTHVPCLNEAVFRDAHCSEVLVPDDSTLLLAVLAVAAGMHTDPTVQQRQALWYAQAKRLFADADREGSATMELLQVACLLAFHAMVTGELPTLRTLVGNAWRMACSMGLNRLDAHEPVIAPVQAGSSRNHGREERRRVFWTVFLLDRLTAFPCGLPFAIDDRQFLVNLPLAPIASFDTGLLTPDNDAGVAFTRNLHSLVLAKPSNNVSSVPVFHHVVKAYVLLGRIVEYVYSLHTTQFSSDGPDPEAAELDTALILFRLNLPRTATDLLCAKASDRRYVVWLGIILNANTILLHFWQFSHRYRHDPSASGTEFEYCFIAAKAIISLVKEACRMDTSLVASPHFAPAFYLCSRILLIQGRCEIATSETAQAAGSWRTDVELLITLFHNMGEAYKGLELKFTTGIREDLQLDDEGLRRLCESGSRGLLLQCSSSQRRDTVSLRS
jgi:hypothetical protein